MKDNDRALWSCLENVVKRYPYLPPTPFAMLVEIGMTGRNPAYREILDQVLESDPTEYKAAIRAHPWLTNGWVPLEVQMDALKAVLPFLMSKPEEDDPLPSDFWAKVGAKYPDIRHVIEREIMELSLGTPPGGVS